MHRRRHLGLGAAPLTAGPRTARPVAPLERTLERGIMTGMVAAFVMALFTMVVAASRGLGLYTPLYLVTAVVEPGPLEVSQGEAAQGWRFYLELGPAVAGMAVNLGIGAVFGALFALVATVLRLHGVAATAATGAAYGLVVAALMGLVLLPWSAGETAGGQVIADAPRLLGWPVFWSGHLLYGLVLGVLFGLLAFRGAERRPTRPNSPSATL